jgi:putative ABC transport system substrate-binding protein
LAPYPERTAAGRIDLDELRGGLRDLGWIEGKNLVIEIRWAGENPRRQRELAAELRALPVDLILAPERPPSARRVMVLPAFPSS